MKTCLIKPHVLAVLIFTIVWLISVFSTDNPLILLSFFISICMLFTITENKKYIKQGILYFVPFAAVTLIINFIFVGQGNIVLFIVLDKAFTLEALIYAAIFAFKLLLIIYIFNVLNVMIDSDSAVSYFSSKMPKSTLMLMIAFKLFPSMKSRLASIKEVYSIRGLDYDKKTIKENIVSYLPVMSVLLETSMEGAFDIGEAAYVRGFLSGKRSVYQRQKLNKHDFMLTFYMLIFSICFIFIKMKGSDAFNIYYNFQPKLFINMETSLLCLEILIVPLLIWFASRKAQ